ncbi:hypothetical protein [Helicobacter sp.]|uniref:hypothetical protein n=1 Tax=Helicobacter sp. TaxID=218 RepID=UPI002A90B15A|nr:hypothetical protein [Helicobacter sp.]MDY5556299.1 hypothetical protein [Helicobacter sp.]
MRSVPLTPLNPKPLARFYFRPYLLLLSLPTPPSLRGMSEANDEACKCVAFSPALAQIHNPAYITPYYFRHCEAL